MDIALPEADALLVVPPLAHLTWPALGVHQLEACARAAGFEVAILYASALYAARIGVETYAALCNAPVHWLLGERLFARAAYGAPPLGFATDAFLEEVDRRDTDEIVSPAGYVDHLSDSTGEAIAGGEYRYGRAMLARCEAEALALAEEVATAVAARGYPVVGASSTFDQTSACVAILQRVKEARPATRTLLGGANCDGDMALGVRSLGAAVDHVFSGESEATFVGFLAAVRAGAPPTEPVVRGAPCTDLDALPTPSFAEYFAQLPQGLGDTPTWVLYETSRGCWWGAKHHCTFCGLNAQGMGFRQKSPDRVVAQLRETLAQAPTHRVCLTDNIMPHAYHRTLVPRLQAEVPFVRIFYEQKANLTLSQVKALHDAGCQSIQPGIEALDSDLLRRMRKGVLARQNVALLRYAATVGMNLKWNLLWGFPGDDARSYEATLALIPLLHHLIPPQALAHLHLDRFSPYFEEPGAHGITDLRPLPGYGDTFPATADLDRLAYHFQGQYAAGSHEAEPLLHAVNEAVQAWQARWEGPPPILHLRRTAPGTWLLTDTRGLHPSPAFWLNDAMARAVLVGGPLARVPAAEWALRNRFAVDLDGWCVPLATAPYTLLAELEEAARDSESEAMMVVAP